MIADESNQRIRGKEMWRKRYEEQVSGTVGERWSVIAEDIAT